MKELQIIKRGNQLVTDSREVAEMVERQHKELMRDIRHYCEVLNERKIAPVDFFIESTYTDNKGEARPCFLITRKGCDMVANKMTGEKGIVFTAQYVTQFEEMEKTITKKHFDELKYSVRLCAKKRNRAVCLLTRKLKYSLVRSGKRVSARDITAICPTKLNLSGKRKDRCGNNDQFRKTLYLRLFYHRRKGKSK